jgi:hypothetical protein
VGKGLEVKAPVVKQGLEFEDPVGKGQGLEVKAPVGIKKDRSQRIQWEKEKDLK